MERLRSLIKEVLTVQPKKDCNCGCGGCDKKSPIITEGRIKKAISEGLTYHVENKIPLHESVYRIGSEKHFALINEARKLWTRGLIDVSKDDQAILETHLGNFGLYETVNFEGEEYDIVSKDGEWVYLRSIHDTQVGRKEIKVKEKDITINEAEVPLDMPMVHEGTFQGNEIAIYGGEDGETYIEKRGTGYYGYNSSFDFTVKDKAELKQMLSGWGYYPIAGSIDENLNEAEYPDFDLDKNIKYQDTSISSGMWRYTGKEQGGKGVYRNLMNDQFLGFSSDDFDFFKKHLGSHFDISESLDEAKKKNKKKKKDPPLNKPKRGGSKAYYVYVRDPKTKKIKKVSFGSGGLRAKIKNPKARKAFAARHNCDKKKDRTTAGYWSCNLPRYADQLGLGSKMNTFW